MFAERLTHRRGSRWSWSLVVQADEWAGGCARVCDAGCAGYEGTTCCCTSSLIVCHCGASIAAGTHRDGWLKNRDPRTRRIAQG